MADTPSSPPPPGKRPAVGLQIKLPSATLDEVRARYGEELKQNRFFIRTKSPRPKDTLVRLECTLADGSPCFKAAGVVVRAQEAGTPGVDPGMGLSLLAVDDAGRDLILSLGGKPPQALKVDVKPAPGAAPRSTDPKQAPAAKPAPGAVQRASDPKQTPA
ncbi:MAG: hypothetical protein JST92_22810, partial [Deltaproteobacteria bacterium]|nr:hypothetical protein [Deltaproteobacteria bacterium]